MSGAAPSPERTFECAHAVAPALLVAACGYNGPPRLVGEAFDQVLSWADVYHIEQWGPLVGVYSDLAAGDAPLEAEAWLPVPPGATAPPGATDDVFIREVEATPVVSVMHRGYPDTVGRALVAALTWAEAQGLARASCDHRQVYHEAPKGRPGEWVVEVQVPVRSGGDGEQTAESLEEAAPGSD